MRKGLYFLLIALLCSIVVEAQTNSAAFNKDTKWLGISGGWGLGNHWNIVRTQPVITLNYDQCFFEHVGPGNIGLGATFAFKYDTRDYSFGGFKASWANYVLGIRGTYHFTTLLPQASKLNPYAGSMLGINITRYHDSYYDHSFILYKAGTLQPAFRIFAGLRYSFSDRFAVFSELGYNTSLISAGLSVYL